MTMLTVDQALALCRDLVNNFTTDASTKHSGTLFPAVICTAHRAVVFGYITDAHADPMLVKNARMCLRWSTQVGGVFGLSDKGPFDASKSGNTTISAKVDELTLKGITAVFSCEPAAEKAWNEAPVAGR